MGYFGSSVEYGERRTKAGMIAQLEKEGIVPVKSKMYLNNTLRYIQEDGTVVYRFFDTDIVTLFPDGRVKLNTGGWFRRITAERINHILQDVLPAKYRGKKKYGDKRYYSDYTVWPDKGTWYLNKGFFRFAVEEDEWIGTYRHWKHTRSDTVPFEDGMVIIPGKKLRGLSEQALHEQKELRKQINAYCKAVQLSINANGIPYPSDGGDCDACHLKDDAGNGIECKDVSHLLEHLKEGYYSGRLLYNAVCSHRDWGYKLRKGQFDSLQWEWGIKMRIGNILRDYLLMAFHLPVGGPGIKC